jgi:hypothetical protein
VDSGSLEEIEDVVIRDRNIFPKTDRRADHCDRQATGKWNRTGNRHARLMSDNGREPTAGARLVILKTVGNPMPRKIRLGRHQGKSALT